MTGIRTNRITRAAARPPRGSRQITLSLNTLSLVPDPLGAGIGGIAGGVIGSISGVTVAEKVYDWAFTPGECDQYVICGEE